MAKVYKTQQPYFRKYYKNFLWHNKNDKKS